MVVYTNEFFICRAREVHGNKYDYSRVVYKNSKSKVPILCSNHGLFNQSPNQHLRGRGCPVCGIEKRNDSLRDSLQDFIKKALKIHGDRYDYFFVVYKNNHTLVDILCHKHGIFKQIPNSHLNGNGCPICANESNGNKQRLSTQEFINKAENKHGKKYDYSKVEYKGCFVKIIIGCLKHGVFMQGPNEHIAGIGCPSCAKEFSAAIHRYSTDDFINKAIKVHGNKFDYSLVAYEGCYKKIKIICSKHDIFLQAPAYHLHGAGCPSCSEPHGEKKIALLLNANKICYVREKAFDQCKDIRQLYFDFYLPDLNICIEFDGPQHFSPCKYFGGVISFEKTKKHDTIKNDFCYRNGIKLIRLSYKQKDSEIASIIEKELKPNMQG